MRAKKVKYNGYPGEHPTYKCKKCCMRPYLSSNCKGSDCGSDFIFIDSTSK